MDNESIITLIKSNISKDGELVMDAEKTRALLRHLMKQEHEVKRQGQLVSNLKRIFVDGR